MRLGRTTAFAFLVCCPIVRAAAGTACRTPSGVPCHTLHVEKSIWRFGEPWNIQHSSSVRTRAVRSEGSVAVRERRSKGLWDSHPKVTGRIYFSGTDQLVRWNAADHTWSKRAAMVDTDRLSPSSHGACENGTGIIAGLKAIEATTQSGSTEIRVWYAPALNCAAIRAEVTTRNEFGFPIYIQTAVVTSIEWGEPNALLFQLPANYRLVADPALPFVEAMKQSETQARQSGKRYYGFVAAGPPEEWTSFNILQ